MSRLTESQHLHIPLIQIESATKNFKTCIGKGGYGLVYKGELSIAGKPTPVAVKRLNEELGQGLKEFLTEIQLLSGHKHPNLISLLGYCEEGNEKIIVYEYAEHGSLDKYLKCSDTTYSLTWMERLKLCVGAARGLDFLHNHVGDHHRIIHRDIKSGNILIDHNWEAKISDLGLSKLCLANVNRSAVISHACGTPAYWEPEYISTGILTKESDIYSFGVVLFEVLCGRLCIIDDHGGWTLSGPLARAYYKNKKLDDIIDPNLRKQMSLDSMNTFSAIAYGCLRDDRGQRPTMGMVVKALEGALGLQMKEEMKGVVDKEVDYQENFKRLAINPPLVYSSRKELFSLLHEGILSDDGERSIEWMKLVCHELAVATNDSEGSSVNDIIKDADRLVSCLTTKATKTLDFSVRGASSRACKHVLNTLIQVIKDKRLALALNERTLDNLMTELLLWLLDERVSWITDGSLLQKAMNELILMILDNAERTSSFIVLINLLRPLEPSRWPSPPTYESFTSRYQKFSESVVKCLIKLTKALQSTIFNVNIDRILQSIHFYLQEHGMEEIRRPEAEDKPLRMVKTLVHELVMLHGIAIRGHLSMIPIYMEPRPIILAYIDHNLQNLSAGRHGPQLKQQLAAIFKEIEDEKTQEVGLYELYHITQMYPEVDIFSDLQNASAAFRKYIKKCLAQQDVAAIFKEIEHNTTQEIGLYELYHITQMYPEVDIFSELKSASETFRAYIENCLDQMKKNDVAGKTVSIEPMS